MFEFQYFLTAGLIMIGFVSAVPPRLLLSHLKNRRPREDRHPASLAAGGDRCSIQTIRSSLTIYGGKPIRSISSRVLAGFWN